MKDNVLEVTNISKLFKQDSHNANSNFREALMHLWQGLFKKRQTEKSADLTALDHINFELQKGDILGIIGGNGAGKSTLLKIIAGILQPSEGEVRYRGRLVSILELGAGFHPDLTGQENVFLNGSLLGLSRSEISARFDSIVAFSDLGDFIHQPVKYYSNGMYLRLAFSIFTHLELDILLLDEVMAVGDAIFRQKSYNQISELANSGTTIIIVSHNPHEIKDLCNKCLWLENGKAFGFGNAIDIVDRYLEKSFVVNQEYEGSSTSKREENYVSWSEGLSIKEVIKVHKFGIRARSREPGQPILLTDDLVVTIEFEKINDHESIEITICVLSFYSIWVLVDSYSIYKEFDGKVTRKGHYFCKCTIPAGILNFGVYQLGFLVSKQEKLIYQIPGLVNFKIAFEAGTGVKANVAKGTASIIKPLGTWEIEHR